MENKEEIWKQCEDLPEGYEISNLGGLRRTTVIYLKTQISAGYERITIGGRGIYKAALIHRLVGKAFIDNPLKKPQINHKDGNKLNNRVDNLEWATRSENQLHAYRNKLQLDSIGGVHWSARLTEEDFIEIRNKLDNGYSMTQLAKELNMSRCQLYFLYQKLKTLPKSKEVFK
jgi:hypothetical protein